jgi:hypothetical protein
MVIPLGAAGAEGAVSVEEALGGGTSVRKTSLWAGCMDFRARAGVSDLGWLGGGGSTGGGWVGGGGSIAGSG